jgi:hypothetical protein
MTTRERYLAELASALRVRGAARRRFLRECRDHLADATAERGEEAAVRSFGPAAELAAAFDAVVAARRGVRSTLATGAGVLGTLGSTLTLIHAATPGVTAPVPWAIAFFVAAQCALVAAGLALLQALVLRRSAMPPGEMVLLARRNGCALLAAGATMFSAGAALPGHGSAVLLLVGPALWCGALVAVLRARSLARRLDGAAGRVVVRPPLEDLGRMTRLPVPPLDSVRLLALTTCLAAAGAFVRDRAEQATLPGAFLTAGVEATAVVACFVLLGPALGLWSPRELGRARSRS